MLNHTSEGEGNMYRYTIIRYRNNLLGESKIDIPLAVVVETEDGQSGFIIGREPELPESLSELSRSILKKFPEIVSEQLFDARKSGTQKRLTEVFSEIYQWNIYTSAVKRIQETCNLEEVAFSIFNSRVSKMSVRKKETESKKQMYGVKRDELFRLTIPEYAI